MIDNDRSLSKVISELENENEKLRQENRKLKEQLVNVEKTKQNTRRIYENAENNDKLIKFLHIVEQSPAVVVITSTNGNIEYVNPKFTQITGYNLKEVKGKNPRILKSGKSLQKKDYKDLWDTISSGNDWYGEFSNKRKDGSLYWESATITSLKNENGEIINYLKIAEDITKRKKLEEKIKESNEERGILLKEIHHRVKNNLQIISSLLNLQANKFKDKINDKRIFNAFKESQTRIKAMALIHENLYQSKTLARIDISKYIKNLVISILNSYARYGKVNTNIDIPKTLLNIDLVVPCGLIINEIVSNTLKYAFPNDEVGEINISLKKNNSNNAYYLTIGDNGVGIPEDIDLNKSDTLGFVLINCLVSQIRGNIELNRDNGTEFKIYFKEKE